MDNLTDSIGLELEQNYVKSTYEDIADDFSSTRYRKWPKVESFLKNVPRFSLILDVGCGNGKYLDNDSTFNVGCDASSNLLSICRSRKFEVANCDMMKLPFNNETFDAIICIAALHHIVSSQRRKICLENMINLLANEDSRLLVQVWSYEQELERNNPYLNPNKMRPDKDETMNLMQVGGCKLPIHKNRTPFSHQDLLVPFNVKRHQSSSSTSKEASGEKEVCCDKTQYLRYYHVFKQNELEALVAEISNATLVESYYDKDVLLNSYSKKIHFISQYYSDVFAVSNKITTTKCLLINPSSSTALRMMDRNQDLNYDSSMDPIGDGGGKSSRGMDSSLPVASGTFSIATPAVTTILPMTENMNDSSFLLPMTSYQQSGLEKSLSSPPDISSKSSHQSEASINLNLQQNCSEVGQQDVSQTVKLTDEKDIKPNLSQSRPVTDDHPATCNEDAFKSAKKRTKGSKKSTKLDAKSKLEKSRQSARECRARKKLRYQYLEDLVCNREKAVVKLREEFSVFCELSKKIDVGTISESDRRLLTDQTKENSQNETTSLL